MLKIIPKAWWSHTFSVTDGTKDVAQSVNRSCWRDEGELRIQHDIYTARRDRASYVLESTAGVLVRAERQRRWFREFVIAHSGRRYTLRARSAFRRQFLLFDGSTEVGSISPAGCFTRKAEAEFPQALPLFLKIFIIWLAMTLWKHEDSAFAASGGGAISAGG